MKCPICSANLKVAVNQAGGDTLKVCITDCETNDSEGLYNVLLQALHNYWRWRAEDQPIYQKEQYYYDSYHAGITYHIAKKEYSFDIQTYDSPDGDTWWHGTFRISGNHLEIIEQHSTRN
jgi:hypothetical protein